jgi:hypothetical protein
MVFFMLGSADESRSTAEETWKMWENICMADVRNQDGHSPLTVNYSFGPMILLDPGSLAFDFPEKHGYRLLSRTLEDYVRSLSLPSWHQWLSYETRFLNRAALVDLIIESIQHSIGLREKYGLYNRLEAAKERLHFVDTYRWVISQVDSAMQDDDSNRRTVALETIKKALDKIPA